jgi:hypothetical protein
VIEYEKTAATADQRILITNEYALETDDTEIKISVALTESGELWRAPPAGNAAERRVYKWTVEGAAKGGAKRSRVFCDVQQALIAGIWKYP